MNWLSRFWSRLLKVPPFELVTAVIYFTSANGELFTRDRYSLIHIYPVTYWWSGHGGLFLLGLCVAMVLLMVVFSLMEKPFYWFTQLVLVVFLLLSLGMWQEILNVWLDQSEPVRVEAKVLNVHQYESGGRAETSIVFQVNQAVPDGLSYSARLRPKLFDLYNARTKVDFMRCEGYFGKPYVCNRKEQI